MADELNGGGPLHRALRLAFAPGTMPDAAPVVAEPSAVDRLRIDGKEETAKLTHRDGPRARLTTDTGTHDVLIHRLPDARRAALGTDRLEVVVDGWRFEIDVQAEARARLHDKDTRKGASASSGGPSELRAIIPGRVVSIDVAEGDSVDAGNRLLVLEAMKMQNELRAPRGGTGSVIPH